MHVARANGERFRESTQQSFRFALPNARYGAKAPHHGSAPAAAEQSGGVNHALRTAEAHWHNARCRVLYRLNAGVAAHSGSAAGPGRQQPPGPR